MLAKLRGQLTYANVMASVAVFLALGGGAYALTQIDPDSVKSKHIAAGQVKQADLARPQDWIEFANEDFLGADSVTCRTPGGDLVIYENDWANDDPQTFNTAGYYRDPYGSVHLKGRVTRGDCPDPPAVAFAQAGSSGQAADGDSIATLPPGYRPAKENVFGKSIDERPPGGASTRVNERGDVHVTPEGVIEATTPSDRAWVSLDGITFRCAPSSQNGCP